MLEKSQYEGVEAAANDLSIREEHLRGGNIGPRLLH
jgi:hypothetical protein